MKDAPEFTTILNSCKKEDFVDYVYLNNSTKHFPTVGDAICHLKLLKAFSVYKLKIVGDRNDRLTIKTWQVFLTNAVRRFILYILALKHYHKVDTYYDRVPDKKAFDRLKDDQFVDILNWVLFDHDQTTLPESVLYLAGKENNDFWIQSFNECLPPLDVVIVWHSFLLNPKSFYDVFTRNEFLQFANYPFPLHQLSLAIDDVSFEYCPSEKQVLHYRDVVLSFSQDDFALQYDIHHFSMYEQLVSVYCPVCNNIILDNIPLSNDENNGFADEDFLQQKSKSSSCKCPFNDKITHDELRKRQLFADIIHRVPFAGMYKYFSKIVSHSWKRHTDYASFYNDIFQLIEIVKSNPDLLESKPLSTIIAPFANLRKHRKTNLLFRNYLQMNLIHLTVKDGIHVWEDLVGCIIRQERFIEKMNSFDWLHSPVMKEGLVESIVRYSRFFNLLSRYDTRRMLVPTLDIDLIWHTHQLSLCYYFEECMSSPLNCVIDHDDKVEEGRLDTGFEFTSKLYRSKFKQNYSICYCWYCVATRANAQSKLKSLFKRKDSAEKEKVKLSSHPLYMNSLGLTHISLHNAIELPTLKAQNKRKKLQQKYDLKKLPWEEESRIFTWGMYPGVYVLPPFIPIAEGCQLFYGDSLCCTVRDFGPTCSGLAGCGTSCGSYGGDNSGGHHHSNDGGGCGSGGCGGGGCGGGGGGN